MTISSLRLQDVLGYRFKTPGLLERALTHRSYAATHNERLEFLGDSVLNCAVSILLFELYPDIDEGKLSRIRSHLVKQDTLAELGRQVELECYLHLGSGEVKSSPVIKDSIIADSLEAIFGAILLDADFDTSKACVIRLVRPLLASKPIEFLGKDPKTRLQEYLQAKKLNLPSYEIIVEGGTSTSPEFRVRCQIEQLGLSREGLGHSRRIAEQKAAEELLSDILKPDDDDQMKRHN